MRFTVILDKVLEKILIGYIELVYYTSSIEFQRNEIEDGNLIMDCILGFWHGDSFVMNLLLKKISKEQINLKVVVTASERGNYIEHIINTYGGRALRMPDGVKMKSFLKELKEESKEPRSTSCIALDGPLGPFHDPKKIGFMLARDGNKPFVGINVKMSKKISIKKRWDNYNIPLPFTKIYFRANNFGVITGDFIKGFNEKKNLICEKLIIT